MRSVRRAVGTLFFVLSACGGSGGGGGGGGPPIVGSYHLVGFEADAAPTPTGRASWGAADLDGLDATLSTTSNVNGTVSGPIVGLGIPFENEADGTIRFFDPISTDETARGTVASGETVATLGEVDPGAAPAILAMTKTWSTTASDADLSGTYHVVVFQYDAGTASSTVFRLTFDGAGAGSAEEGYVSNSNGTVIAGLRVISSITYAVAADGGLTIDSGFGRSFVGGLHESRDLAVLAGSANTGPPALLFLVRVSAAAGTATFSGTYGMAGLALDYATPAFRSFTGSAAPDGLGAGTVDGTTDEEGVVTDEPPAGITYSVAANGTLVVSTPGGDLQGAVSPGGQFAVLGGSISAGSDPAIYLLSR